MVGLLSSFASSSHSKPVIPDNSHNSPHFNTNNKIRSFIIDSSIDADHYLLTGIGIGIPGTSSSNKNKRNHQRDTNYSSSISKKIKIFGYTLTQQDLKHAQNPEANNDSEFSRIPSKDSQFPVIPFKDYKFPGGPSKDFGSPERFKRICIEPSLSRGLIPSDRKHFNHALSCSTDIASEGLKVYKVEYIWNAELEERYSKAKVEYEKQGWMVSECNVFHATDDDALEKIIVEGFKIGGQTVRIKHGSKLGLGIYTAINACYPLRYTKQPYKLVLCVAMLADIKKTEVSNKMYESNHTQSRGVLLFKRTSDLVPRYIVHYN